MRRKDREVTDIKEMETMIQECKVCHLAMTDGLVPYVVPLNFGYVLLADGTLELYFHSAKEGKKLEILKQNNKVSFELSCEGELTVAEPACNSGCYFSSVIGFGEVVFLEAAEEKCEALSVLFQHQTGKDVTFEAAQAEHVCIYKVVSRDFTGKRNAKAQ